MTTVEEFAEARYLDPGDVRVTVAMLVDLHDDELPGWVVDEVDDILNPWSFRTVPEIITGGQRRAVSRPCRCHALGGLEHEPGPGCPAAAVASRGPGDHASGYSGGSGRT